MKEQKEMPSKEITVKIGQNEYKIKFPKNADLIDIESAKIRMTGGTIKDMAYGGAAAVNAFVAVEAIATFEILLLDQLTKDLTVGSLSDLDSLQLKPVIKAYEQYYKWMTEWREFLNADVEEEVK